MRIRTVRRFSVTVALVGLLLTDTRLAHAGGCPVGDEPIAEASVDLEPSETASLHSAAPDLESNPRADHEEQSKQQSQQSRPQTLAGTQPAHRGWGDVAGALADCSADVSVALGTYSLNAFVIG